MTTPSTTVAREFTGILSVGGETIPATVRFANREVILMVATDTIGIWPLEDISFQAADNGFDILAEGDSVRFVPEGAEDFGAYLDGSQPPPVEERPPVGSLPADLPPHPRRAENGPGLDSPSASDDLDSSSHVPGMLRDGRPAESGLDEPPVPVDFRSLFTETPTDPDDWPADDPPADHGLTWDDVTDEYFAAGLTGPSDAPAMPSWGWRGSAHGMIRAADPPAALEETPGGRDPMPQPEPPAVEEAPAEPDGDEADAPLAPEPEIVEEEADDLPEPVSEDESLRQWVLIAAGAAVVAAIAGVVVWGLIALVGRGDTQASQPVAVSRAQSGATTTPAAPPAIAPLTTVTAPAPPVTVDPESTAVAAAFVDGWNQLAREYAYHLSIDGDRLPLSTAPAPTVHLTYGENGVLTLTMAPKGTGSDRDLLLSMGVAVAWADPSLSPDGRRDLLSALGVNVDDPQVGDMGGEVSRNGVDYSLTVAEGIIRFRVSPAR